MKECRECEYFVGYDYFDGTPRCEFEGGYECCPYNDCSEVKKTGLKIEIDSQFMSDYITHTLKNTMFSTAYEIAEREIKAIVDKECKQRILDEMTARIKIVVDAAIAGFMAGEITIGGGWGEPARILTRDQYLSEVVEKELDKRFKSDVLKSYAEEKAQSAIDSFERKLRDEVNAGVQTYFNQATRQVLTDNVVSMLMCNDTYKKLSDSMKSFLPEGK